MAVATRLAVAAHDRVQLTAWVRAATTRRSLAERARIILLSAEGLSAAARRAARGRAPDGLQMAPAVCGARPGRPARSAAAGPAAAPVPRAGTRHPALDGRADSA